ncbi:DNA-binding response regulator [Enterobacterales bacterium CwR94]|nr:DNA-binding response regulator [Enterobacterales bacterium CwR94]
MDYSIALVVDDHPLVARGIASFLQHHCGFRDAAVVTSGEAAQRYMLAQPPPDLIIADFWLSDGTALSLLREAHHNYAPLHSLVMSGDDNNEIWRQVRDAGADGYIHKNETPEIFAQAVKAVMSGQYWFPQIAGATSSVKGTFADFGLTQRQIDVLQMMMRGYPNKRIAAYLEISETTVKEHVSHILNKLGVKSRVEAITLLHQRRIAS